MMLNEAEMHLAISLASDGTSSASLQYIHIVILSIALTPYTEDNICCRTNDVANVARQIAFILCMIHKLVILV